MKHRRNGGRKRKHYAAEVKQTRSVAKKVKNQMARIMA